MKFSKATIMNLIPSSIKAVMYRKRKLIIGGIALLVIILLAIHHHKKNLELLAQHAAKPILVKVEKPLQQSLPITVSATASLVADKSTIITPRASGYIRGILFHEGQAVTKGETLFQLDSQTQQDAVTAAQASDGLAKLQFARDQQFLKKGYITQDTYYSAKVALKQNQANLQTAETNFSDRTIEAPFSGTIGALPVSLGDYVNPGNTLTTLVDNNHLRVEYALPVKYLSQIQLNQPVTVFDSSHQHQVTATVSYIAPSVDPSTQTIAVHARIDNTAQLFKPGEYATIKQQLGTQNNTLLVPEQSVLASISGYSIFVMKNNKAIKVPVKIGNRIDSNVVIKHGLTPTDEVIVAGENEVKNNIPVRLK
jgi:membrane fusion protein (multidrug efflux system)